MPLLVRVCDLDDLCSDLRVIRSARRLGRNWQLQRRGLFKPALQIKYGELLLLFSLPSNVQFHCVWYEVMKLVIYLHGEENILLCGKQ